MGAVALVRVCAYSCRRFFKTAFRLRRERVQNAPTLSKHTVRIGTADGEAGRNDSLVGERIGRDPNAATPVEIRC
jgi:hypothetical protein